MFDMLCETCWFHWAEWKKKQTIDDDDDDDEEFENDTTRIWNYSFINAYVTKCGYFLTWKLNIPIN